MASIYDWSSTADDNADSDADLTWAEGQNPNTVNNSARMMMKRMRDLLTDLAGGTVVTGTANGLVLSTASNFTSLANGRIASFRAAANNTGAVTLNVNGLGAKAVRVQTPSGDAALVANTLRTGGVYLVMYSTTANGGAGAWILQSSVLIVGNSTWSGGALTVANGGTGKTTLIDALRDFINTLGTAPSGYFRIVGKSSGGVVSTALINTSTGAVSNISAL